MIQQQTVLKVADNSGAKKAVCIKVLGGFKRKFAYLGDVIVVSIIVLYRFKLLLSQVVYKLFFVLQYFYVQNNFTVGQTICLPMAYKYIYLYYF